MLLEGYCYRIFFHHTSLVFHKPLLKACTIYKASTITDMDMANHIPSSPQLSLKANKYANRSLKPTLAISELIIAGRVSPAPCKTPP